MYIFQLKCEIHATGSNGPIKVHILWCMNKIENVKYKEDLIKLSNRMKDASTTKKKSQRSLHRILSPISTSDASLFKSMPRESRRSPQKHGNSMDREKNHSKS